MIGQEPVEPDGLLFLIIILFGRDFTCASCVQCETVALHQPAWRNWQTRWTQNPVLARVCGFEPLRRHWNPADSHGERG